MNETCASCGTKTDLSYCDSCHMNRLENLLKNHWWITWRGVAKGDLPGETLADTFRRELRELKENQ